MSAQLSTNPAPSDSELPSVKSPAYVSLYSQHPSANSRCSLGAAHRMVNKMADRELVPNDLIPLLLWEKQLKSQESGVSCSCHKPLHLQLHTAPVEFVSPFKKCPLTQSVSICFCNASNSTLFLPTTTVTWKHQEFILRNYLLQCFRFLLCL